MQYSVPFTCLAKRRSNAAHGSYAADQHHTSNRDSEPLLHGARTQDASVGGATRLTLGADAGYMPTLLLVTASALSLGWWLPQLIRILRRGSAGVSPTTWAIATANVTLWGFWALLAGQPWVVTVEWVQAAGSLLVVLTIGLTRSALIAAGCVAVVVLVAQPWPVVASVAAVASVLAVRGPQL